MKPNYKIAFSFRSRVRLICIEPLANELERYYGFSNDDIFIDVRKNIAGFSGIQTLREIYAHRSEIICVFISDDYFDSEICAQEWESIKTLYEDKCERVIPICMGMPGEAFWSKAGICKDDVICLDLEKSSIQTVAEKINERYNTVFPTIGHNSKFADIYTEQLCLHKNSPYNVSLKNVYIEPNVLLGDDIKMPICEMIDKFLSENKDILMIFGEGGFGKTSTIAKLAYDYESGQKKYDKELVIIRLRWIAKYMDKNRNVFSAICKFMKIDPDNIPKNTIWILDGLDELCMLSGTNESGTIYSGASGYIKQLCKLVTKNNSKIIITTRPGIDQTGFTIYFAQAGIRQSQCTILNFDEGQTNDFICNLVNADPDLKENNGGIRFLNSDKKYELVTDVYYSAFILYLICSNDLTDEECANIWAMFHRIFHKSLVIPEYRYDGAEGSDINEFNTTYINDIYKINSQIAFEMFKTRDDNVTFTLDNVKRLLDISDGEIINRINDSYSLCCYLTRNNGIVEFAHNDIRDFFICEKILTELSAAYAMKYSAEDMVNKLCCLLKYNMISDETAIFIKNAFEYKAYPEIASQPVEHIKDIFTLFLKSGGLLHYNYAEEKESYHYYSKNTVNNSAAVYELLYNPSDNVRIVWFDKNEVQRERHNVIEYMSDHLAFSDFSNMDLSYINLSEQALYGCDFSNTKFHGADLRNANLSDSVLKNANLDYAYISGAIFTGADLSNAHLQGADMNAYVLGADFEDANLSGATYNSDTVFPDDFEPNEHNMIFEDV